MEQGLSRNAWQDFMRAQGVVARPRPFWKTLLVSMLLCLIPVIGWSMASMYVVTRQEPDRYDAGAAAGAGAFLVLWALLITMVVAIVVAVAQGA